MQAKQHLQQVHPDLGPVSEITIRRWLKGELRMSFKKLEIKNIQTLAVENIWSFWESAALLLELEKSMVEQIYIDEFTVSARRNGFYGWARKGQKGALRIHSDNFSMSFVIAFSSEKIYGMIGSTEAMTAKTIAFFIKEVCEYRNRESCAKERSFVLVMDNSPLHTARSMKCFLKQSRLRAVTISPYWPALNPWEKAINAIKYFMKKDQSTGRYG